MKKSFKIGDIVRYSSNFLESTYQDIYEDISDLQGKIIDIKPPVKIGGSTVPGRAKIHWEDDEISSALFSNIELYKGCPKASVKNI